MGKIKNNDTEYPHAEPNPLLMPAETEYYDIMAVLNSGGTIKVDPKNSGADPPQ